MTTASRRIDPGFFIARLLFGGECVRSATFVPEGHRARDAEAGADQAEDVRNCPGHLHLDHWNAADRRLRHVDGQAGGRNHVLDLVQHLGADRRRVLDDPGSVPLRRGIRGDDGRGAGAVTGGMGDHVRDHEGPTELEQAHGHHDAEHDDEPGLDQRLARRPGALADDHHAPMLLRSSSAPTTPSASGTLYGRVMAPGAVVETRSGSSVRAEQAAKAIAPTRPTVSRRRCRRARWTAMMTPPRSRPAPSAMRPARGPSSAPTAAIILTSPPPMPPRAKGGTRRSITTSRPATLVRSPEVPKKATFRTTPSSIPAPDIAFGMRRVRTSAITQDATKTSTAEMIDIGTSRTNAVYEPSDEGGGSSRSLVR